MRLPTRGGVKLSDEEFHGVMDAVRRRINRTQSLGHPAATVDNPQPQPQDWQQMFSPDQGGIDNAESS